MAMKSEITLHNQERGEEFGYRILAVNKTGEGHPSNTVMAMLQEEGKDRKTSICP